MVWSPLAGGWQTPSTPLASYSAWMATGLKLILATIGVLLSAWPPRGVPDSGPTPRPTREEQGQPQGERNKIQEHREGRDQEGERRDTADSRFPGFWAVPIAL